jgi:hypothetical protein
MDVGGAVGGSYINYDVSTENEFKFNVEVLRSGLKKENCIIAHGAA